MAMRVQAGRKQVVFLGNTGPNGAREWVVVQYRNLPNDNGERVMRVSQRLGVEPDPEAMSGKWAFYGDIDLLRQYLANVRGKLSRGGVMLLNKLSRVVGAAKESDMERKAKQAVIAALLRARRPDLANAVAKAPEGAPLKSKTGMKLREDLGNLPQFANFTDDNWVHFGNHAKKYGDTRVVFTGALQALLIHAFKRGKALPMTADYGKRWVPKDSLVMKSAYGDRYLDWLEDADVVEKTEMPAKQALKVQHTKRDEAFAKENPDAPVEVYVAGGTLIGMMALMAKYGAKMAAQASTVTAQLDAHDKPGEWNIHVYKSRATRWDFFVKNPQGGGGGSSSYKSAQAALTVALRNTDFKGAKRVWVVIAKWDAAKGDYTVTKTYWHQL